MFGTAKKVFIGLIIVAIIALLTILGLQTYFLFANYRVNKDSLEIQYGKEDERRKKIAETEARRKGEEALRNAQLSKLRGFNPEGKATILDPRNIEHLGIRNHPGGIKCETGEKSPTLIYEDEVNFHFQDILNDIITVMNGEELKSDGYGDNFSKQLKRNNCILYGAPGTGKTVFVDELVHHLYAEYGQKVEQQVQKLEDEIAQLKQERAAMDANGQDTAERTEEEEKERDKKIKTINDQRKSKEDKLAELNSSNLTPPIIQIRGEKLKSAGGIDPNAAGVGEKFLSVVKHYKEKAFGDAYSNEPYIVFVEEADQGVDVMGGTGGKKTFS